MCKGSKREKALVSARKDRSSNGYMSFSKTLLIFFKVETAKKLFLKGSFTQGHFY